MNAIEQAIEQAILDMCESISVVTSAELIAMLTGGAASSISRIDAQMAKNAVVAIDKAMVDFSDAYVCDEYETEEENYARSDKVMGTLEATREYFECVLEYAECFKDSE